MLKKYPWVLYRTIISNEFKDCSDEEFEKGIKLLKDDVENFVRKFRESK